MKPFRLPRSPWRSGSFSRASQRGFFVYGPPELLALALLFWAVVIGGVIAACLHFDALSAAWRADDELRAARAHVVAQQQSDEWVDCKDFDTVLGGVAKSCLLVPLRGNNSAAIYTLVPRKDQLVAVWIPASQWKTAQLLAETLFLQKKGVWEQDAQLRTRTEQQQAQLNEESALQALRADAPASATAALANDFAAGNADAGMPPGREGIQVHTQAAGNGQPARTWATVGRFGLQLPMKKDAQGQWSIRAYADLETLPKALAALNPLPPASEDRSNTAEFWREIKAIKSLIFI